MSLIDGSSREGPVRLPRGPDKGKKVNEGKREVWGVSLGETEEEGIRRHLTSA